MKVLCPECHLELPAENVALDTGWGKCGHCGEVFPLSDVLDGFSSTAPKEPLNERPSDALALVDRTNDSLFIHVPPKGMQSSTWYRLGFATVWIGFLAVWTSMMWNAPDAGHPADSGIFALFSIPFWILGLGLVGNILWHARGTRTLLIDGTQLVTELRCLGWTRKKTIERSRVQSARRGDIPLAQTEANRWTHPMVFPVELIYEKGAFEIPCDTTAERDWLLAETNDFLKAVPVGEAGQLEV